MFCHSWLFLWDSILVTFCFGSLSNMIFLSQSPKHLGFISVSHCVEKLIIDIYDITY
jgi:hypothetical protein